MTLKFQTFWHGQPLSPYEVLCLRSFIKAGHEIDLYTYDSALACPPGVNVLDAAGILEQHEYQTETEGFVGHPGPFTDHFRYKLLYERGGWWVDTDVMLLRTPWEPERYYAAYQDADHVNNAVLFFRPPDDVMADCLNRTRELRSSGPVVWGDTGPFLLTAVLAERGLLEAAAAPGECYPLNQDEILHIFVPGATAAVNEKLQHASFLHLWNAKLVSLGLDKFAQLAPDCWLHGKFNES